MPDDLRLTAEVEITAADAGRGRKAVELVAYTGGPLLLAGFSSPVVIDLEGLEIPASVPLLSDHRNKREHVVGQATAVKSGGRVLASGFISGATAAGKEILKLAADGFRFQASVGATPVKRELRRGEVVGVNGQTFEAGSGLILVTKSKLKEISLVPIGADDQTNVTIAASAKGIAMPDEITPDETTIDDQGTPKARQALVEASGCKIDDLNMQFIVGDISREEWSMQAMKRIQAKADLEAHRAKFPVPFGGAPVGRSSGVKDQDVLACAILRPHHAETALEAMFGERVMEASAHLDVSGIPAAAWKDASRLPAQLQAASSTISLPTLLGDTLHRSAILFYQEMRKFWTDFSFRQPVSDFRNHNTIRPMFAGTAEQLGENGEIKHTSLSEADVFTGKVATFAKMFGVGRQTLINDTVGAIAAQITRSLVDQIVRKQNDTAAEVWLAGIASNHWAAGNGNKQSGATTALSAEGLRTALKLMREQTDAEGKVVEVEPSYLLVGPSLEFTARQLLNSSELSRYAAAADQAPTGNPHQNVLRLIVEPRLENSAYTGAVTGHWWIVGRQFTQPCIAYFLNGIERPTVERDDQDFHVLGEQWRCFMDFGYKLAETRASVYSVGSVGA